MRSEPRSGIYRLGNSLLWHADVPDASGAVVTVCLNTANLDLAKRRLEGHAGAQAQPDHPPPRAPGPAQEVVPGSIDWALAEHLHRLRPDIAEATQGCYRTHAGHLVRLLGTRSVTELCRVHLDEHVAQRRAEQAGAETRRKELMLLRTALRTARQLGAVTAEPEDVLMPRLRSEYTPRERWLEFDEYQRVMKALPEPRQFQVLMACYTGARLGELSRMRWEDIDWRREVIQVRQTKPKVTTRYVPLQAELLEVLKARRQAKGPLLAPFNNLYRELKRACETAGVVRFSLNDCRRTFGSWMVQEGVPVFTVSKLMGHSSPAMVQKVYGRLSDDSLRAAVAKLPRGRKLTPSIS